MPGFRLVDVAIVGGSLVVGVLLYRTIRLVMSTPRPRSVDVAATDRVVDLPGFLTAGWVFATAIWWTNALLARDAFFLGPGELHTLSRWHGMPWPLLPALLALVSPMWLLILVASLLLNGGALRMSIHLVSWLVIAGDVAFWTLLWFQGGRG